MSAERNRRVVQEALSELGDLENVVLDALGRLPMLLGRIQATRAKLAGLLPPEGAAGASSEPESDDPAQGQLVG